MIGADVIIKCLEEEGVEYVFGYPGVAICPFYNSILESDIQTILIRTEQNAAHAASGLARVSGKVGVCAVTSGPGATNLITGIATAFADSIPLVCITGQVNSELLGSDVFQEADITGAVESFVKYSYLVKDAADIPQIFREAFHLASTGRKGPVLIDIPIDVQNAPVGRFRYPDEVNMRTYKPTIRGNMAQIKKVLKELSRAKRPLICAGGGVLLSQAEDALRAFSEKHQIPVVSTMMGIGAMPTEHPMYFGMVGNNGKPFANRAMNESDLLLMVGARVADRAVNQPDLITENKVLVHIDVDPAEIGKNVGPDAFGNEKLIGYLADCRFSFNSYPMNRPALAAGAAALEDDVYFREICGKIIKTRERVKSRLRELGFSFMDSRTNFVFAAHEKASAKEIFEMLKENGIYVRYFAKPRIDNYLRITIGTDEEMDRLLSVLGEYLAGRK